MKKTKPSVKYKTVSLAEPFMMDLIKYVENSNRYRSVADFVRQSVRSQMQYEDSKIWSEDAIRDYRKFKGKLTGKKIDQDEVIDTVIEKPIDDEKATNVINALKEIIREVNREDRIKAKK